MISPQDLEGMSFEQALQRLEQIVGELESGKAELERSIEIYEDGAALKAHCEKKLEAARLKVEKIVLGQGGAAERRSGRVQLMGQASPQIGYEDFERVDIRIGTVIEATPFPEARKPAYKLTIDFGPEIGVKKSSAQVTKHYGLGELIGRRVAAVVNFPPRQIGPVRSEVLCLGLPGRRGRRGAGRRGP